MQDINELFRAAKNASRELVGITDAQQTALLNDLADVIDNSNAEILEANKIDLAKMNRSNPLYDRLQLTPERLKAIASDMRHVAHLKSPVGDVLEDRQLPNGLRIRRVRVPFGVIGVIYEARPNVTFDVFSLCFRSGNACVLKGGSDAAATNESIIGLIHRVLKAHGLTAGCAVMLPPTHEATAAMLNAVGYIDVCIPRGGRRLIDFVRNNARVPVIETGAGVVSTYFDADGDTKIGHDIITNAKTRRVSVCNALDTLLINRRRLSDLPELCRSLALKKVMLYTDPEAGKALKGYYPEELLKSADSTTYATEWMDYKMGIRTVDSVEEAIEHIAQYGSGHSECIVTENSDTADKFRCRIDAACVYVNAPTSFTDGAQFGLGAEIGISTQKLGPRGPMGLNEITTYKYLIDGTGQTRP